MRSVTTPGFIPVSIPQLGYKRRYPPLLMPALHGGIANNCPWRRELQGEGQQIARQLAASKMNVSGLCRSTTTPHRRWRSANWRLTITAGRWTTPLY